MRFRDQVVIITGAASGVGAALALLFAREGARLVLADREPVDGILEKVRTYGVEAVGVIGDIKNQDVNDRIIEKAVGQFERLDVLINNAAIGVIGGVETVDLDAIEIAWRVNFLAPLYLSRQAIPIMRAQGSGAIQFTGALAGMYGVANAVAYSTAKAALINLCKAIAIEHGRDGIRANCVCPGPVDTPMLQGAMKAFDLSREVFHAISPTGRITTAEDVAEAHAFLASRAAQSINGHVMAVDNGMFAGMFTPRRVDS